MTLSQRLGVGEGLTLTLYDLESLLRPTVAQLSPPLVTTSPRRAAEWPEASTSPTAPRDGLAQRPGPNRRLFRLVPDVPTTGGVGMQQQAIAEGDEENSC